jgi:hypothetical protein
VSKTSRSNVRSAIWIRFSNASDTFELLRLALLPLHSRAPPERGKQPSARIAPDFDAEDMNAITANPRTSMAGRWVTLFLGAWLVISPLVLGFAHAPAGISNNVLVGLAIIACSFFGLKEGLLRAAIVLLGAWLYASAFILYVPSRAYLWNNLILAGVVVIAAVTTEA